MKNLKKVAEDLSVFDSNDDHDAEAAAAGVKAKASANEVGALDSAMEELLIKVTSTWEGADGLKMSSADTLKLKAGVKLVNVRQVGTKITGDIEVSVDLGFFDASHKFPFSFDTKLSNPVILELGSFSLPVVGTLTARVEFRYDLPGRELCGSVTLSGLPLAKRCVKF